MKTRFLVGLGACALLAACSPGSPSGTPRFTGGQTHGGGPGTDPVKVLDLSHASAAAPVAGDTTVTLTPSLYADPGNPCASVQVNDFIGKVNDDCSNAYVMTVGGKVVAGQQIIANSPEPRSASVEAGISSAQAITIGNAFFVSEALRPWAISLDVGNIIPTIDGLGVYSDPLYKVVTSKPLAYAVFPHCIYPTSIRVITADSGARDYIASYGLTWPGPSATAVVATYAQCGGAVLNFKDHSTATVLGHDHPVSVVITGHVATVAPFGPIWVEDGWAPCGAAALKSACA